MKLPKEAGTKGKVWHLEKCVYRLIDASFGNLPDGGTQGGYIIFLANEKGKVIPIWNSKKIRRVVRSTLAGETLAMAEGIDMAIFVSTLLTELTRGTPATDGLPLICMTDCKSLHDALKSTKQVGEKRQTGNQRHQGTHGKEREGGRGRGRERERERGGGRERENLCEKA